MRTLRTSWALAPLSAIILALCAMPANAAASNRTWVSGIDGDDANPCTINAPCASFAGALAKTATGGEIDCLSPGDFGTVTITKSISIVCDGVSNGGIINTNSGEAAITVSAGTGAVVYLSGLDINGVAGAGFNGVYVSSGSTVYILHCTIRGLSDSGVNVQSSTSPTRVVINDSIIVNNGYGVFVAGQDSATNAVIVLDSVVDGNANYAAGGNRSNSIIALEKTTLSGSATGLNLTNGATGELIGPSNTIAGAINGTTTSVAFK